VELKVRIAGGVVGQDGFFGEMALVDKHEERYAVAKTDCIVIPISEKAFPFLCRRDTFFRSDRHAHVDYPLAANGRIIRTERAPRIDWTEPRIVAPQAGSPFERLPPPKAQFHLALLNSSRAGRSS